MLTLGEKIRELRINQNMSQDELAKRVGYKSRASINKIELEKDGRTVKLSKIAAFANALGTTTDYLMGWTEDPYYQMGYEMADQLFNEVKYSVDFSSIKKKYAQLLPEARVELENYADLLLLKQSVNETKDN